MSDNPGPASDPPPRPAVPADRYGRVKTKRSRRALAPFVVVGTLIAAGGAAWGAKVYSSRTTAEMVSYETSEGGVRITVLIQRDPARTTECALRARNRAGAEVGRRIVVIPPGKDRKISLTEQLDTSERPITGEIKDCHSVAR